VSVLVSDGVFGIVYRGQFKTAREAYRRARREARVLLSPLAKLADGKPPRLVALLDVGPMADFYLPRYFDHVLAAQRRPPVPPDWAMATGLGSEPKIAPATAPGPALGGTFGSGACPPSLDA
jgi:hypothetical protein